MLLTSPLATGDLLGRPAVAERVAVALEARHASLHVDSPFNYSP